MFRVSFRLVAVVIVSMHVVFDQKVRTRVDTRPMGVMLAVAMCTTTKQSMHAEGEQRYECCDG